MYWFLSCPTWISSYRTISNSFRTSLVCLSASTVMQPFCVFTIIEYKNVKEKVRIRLQMCRLIGPLLFVYGIRAIFSHSSVYFLDRALRGKDTLSRKVNLLKWTWLPCENGPGLKGKNVLLLGAIVFPFSVDPFSGTCCARKQTGSPKSCLLL